MGNDGPSKVPVGSLRSSRIADEIGKLRPLFEDGMYRAYTTEPARTRRGHACRSINDSWKEDETMNLLWALAVVFIVLWAFGFFAFHVTNGLIHLLLVVALVAIVFRLVSGRRLA